MMSDWKNDKCYFCGAVCKSIRQANYNNTLYESCPICGSYHLYDYKKNDLDNIKHLVAGYLYDTNNRNQVNAHGYKIPRDINGDIFKEIYTSGILPKTVRQKLDKLLLYLYKQTEYFGFEHKIKMVPFPVSYSISETELRRMFAELVNLNFGEYKGLTLEDGIGFGDGIETPRDYIHRDKERFILNSNGHARAEELISTNINSKKVFIAMQFSGALLDGIRDNAIKPACAAYGYEAYTVNEEEHNEGIFDKIIAGIKTSRFVIADLTYKNAGAYFEAGYAQGLGIEVIRCCNRKWLMAWATDEQGSFLHNWKGEKYKNNVHFDLQHYNLIMWEDGEDLKQKLMDRIAATIPINYELTDNVKR